MSGMGHWDKGSLPITYRSALGQWPLQDTVLVTCSSMHLMTGGECSFWPPLSTHLKSPIKTSKISLPINWCTCQYLSARNMCSWIFHGAWHNKYTCMVKLTPGPWPLSTNSVPYWHLASKVNLVWQVKYRSARCKALTLSYPVWGVWNKLGSVRMMHCSKTVRNPPSAEA